FGSANSADLAWWESYLLQAYLLMHQATQDQYWLDRFVAHADTVLAVMRDIPNAASYWPGYKDGFLGWGTTRYDPAGRYQEYLVHDGQICLPMVRFVRLVFLTPELQPRYLSRAQRYVQTIERNVIAKWYTNWHCDRGTDGCLERFGGWRSLPVNQYLVFGEVLLVMAEVAKSPFYRAAWPTLAEDWYLNTADLMAAEFRAALTFRAADSSYTWRHWPSAHQALQPEDISHANLVISFVREAWAQGRCFSSVDLARLGNTIAKTMRLGPAAGPIPSRFVDGSGGLDRSGHLKDWLKLGDFHPAVFRLVRQVYGACPAWSGPAAHASQAATVAALAALLPESQADGNDGAATGARFSTASTAPVFRSCVTRDQVTIRRQTRFTAVVTDCSGRRVRVLECNPAGPTEFVAVWYGDDERGRPVAAGTYFCAVVAADRADQLKVTRLP
ncbi:MAG: hypothetical protein ABIK86_02915, partial [candidate division WOR-3 bacterium]